MSKRERILLRVERGEDMRAYHRRYRDVNRAGILAAKRRRYAANLAKSREQGTAEAMRRALKPLPPDLHDERSKIYHLNSALQRIYKEHKR